MRRLDYNRDEFIRIAAAVGKYKATVRALRCLAKPPVKVRIDVPRQDGPAGELLPQQEVSQEEWSEEVCFSLTTPSLCEGGAGNRGGEETCNPEGSGQPPRPIFEAGDD